MIPPSMSYNKPLSFCERIATIDIREDAWTSQTMQVRLCKRIERSIKRAIHLVEPIPCYCTDTAGSEKEESCFVQIFTMTSGSRCLPLEYSNVSAPSVAKAA